jgi:hypothetical protein
MVRDVCWVSGTSAADPSWRRSSAVNSWRSPTGQLSDVALVFSTAITCSAARTICCACVRWTAGSNSPVAAMTSVSSSFGCRGPHAEQRRAEQAVVALTGRQQREPALRPQQPGRLAVPDLGIDPVPCRARDDQVDGCVGRGEVLKRDDLERDGRVGDATAGTRDHRRADVDGGQAEAAPGQPLRELTGSAADLEHVAAGPNGRGADGEVDDVAGVAEPGFVVAVGGAVEQRPLVSPLGSLWLGLCRCDHSLTTRRATPLVPGVWPPGPRTLVVGGRVA